MKRSVILLFVLATVIVCAIAGCSSSSGTTPATDQNGPPTLATLLEKARLIDARINILYVREVPDSSRQKMADWITATVAAASSNMSGGDYESPDDLVEEVCDQARSLFAVAQRRPALDIQIKEKGQFRSVYVEDLTPAEKAVYDYLKQP